MTYIEYIAILGLILFDVLLVLWINDYFKKSKKQRSSSPIHSLSDEELKNITVGNYPIIPSHYHYTTSYSIDAESFLKNQYEKAIGTDNYEKASLIIEQSKNLNIDVSNW